MAVRIGVVFPADGLREFTNSLNFLRFDTSGNDHFESETIFAIRDIVDCLNRGHPLVLFVVSTNADQEIIRDTEVDADVKGAAAAFEFTKPLMRDIEVCRHRHRVDS